MTVFGLVQIAQWLPDSSWLYGPAGHADTETGPTVSGAGHAWQNGRQTPPSLQSSGTQGCCQRNSENMWEAVWQQKEEARAEKRAKEKEQDRRKERREGHEETTRSNRLPSQPAGYPQDSAWMETQKKKRRRETEAAEARGRGRRGAK